MTRPDWDAYFLGIAQAVATRADCTRAKHGAVIVRDNRIVSTGYNGAPAGHPGCESKRSCPRGRLAQADLPSLSGGYDDPTSPGYCVAIHAEGNAIIYADFEGMNGGTIYITGEPCHGCRKLIVAARLARIVYPGGKEDVSAEALCDPAPVAGKSSIERQRLAVRAANPVASDGAIAASGAARATTT